MLVEVLATVDTLVVDDVALVMNATSTERERKAMSVFSHPFMWICGSHIAI